MSEPRDNRADTMGDTSVGGGEVYLPASRSRAWMNGLIRGAGASISGFLVALILVRLDFSTTAISNRIVDFALAVVSLPLVMAALVWGIQAIRWLALALWPAAIGAFASASGLTLRFGPFGTSTYPASELDVRYLFELGEEESDGSYEALLPEEEQRAQFVPRLAHPAATQPLDRVIIRFVAGSEADMAASLRPVVDRWRSERPEQAQS